MEDTRSAILLNSVICRRFLENEETSAGITPTALLPVKDIRWLQVKGITKFWDSSVETDYGQLFTDILSSLVISGTVFSFLIKGDQEGIRVYAGTNSELYDNFKETYRSFLPGVDLTDMQKEDISDNPASFGGIITGYPLDKLYMDEERSVPQIETICRGMLGTSFSFLVLAKRVPNFFCSASVERLSKELKFCSENMRASVTGIGPMGNVTKDSVNYDYQQYSESLEKLMMIMKDGLFNGLWNVTCYYSAKTASEASKLKGIIKASFAGGYEENLESFRCIPCAGDFQTVVSTLSFLGDIDPNYSQHPLGNIRWDEVANTIEVYKYKYMTMMNSKQLSVLCRLPRREYPGYYIDDYVEFDNATRTGGIQNKLVLGDITLPGRNVQTVFKNKYSMDIEDLTRHALIIGITGGGKTNTSKALLRELWMVHHKPFLVIESAKREYWELMNVEPDTSGNSSGRDFHDLKVFTLGSEVEGESIKYRINPFEKVGMVALQTHIDYLLATFKASFDMYPPMPQVLEAAVHEVYQDRGWDIVQNRNIYGLRDYPTLTDLYYKIDTIVDKYGYGGEIRSNVKAALKARVNSLRIGGKGEMLDTQKSVPLDSLLTQPVVLELEDLGDDDTKAFVIGVLLVQLYEYRKSNQKGGSKLLQHILLVEEAHRLLKNVPASSEGSSTRANSVEFFCNMLAEIRSFGQGIVIADQIPTKLASDTIKNTNLKIVHRTVMKEDREAVGFSMNMTPEQINYLSSLRRGCAAVYAEGDNEPKLVMMPLIRDVPNKLTRVQVLGIIRERLAHEIGNYETKYRHHAGCIFCEERCRHREVVTETLNGIDLNKYLEKLRVKFDAENLFYFRNSIRKNTSLQLNYSRQICLTGHMLERSGLTFEDRVKTLIQYITIIFTVDQGEEK